MTATNVGGLILASTAATPNDSDYFTLITNAGVLEKLTGTNLKVYLKTYFDTLYPAETATTIGALIGNAGDAAPNDTDYVATSLTSSGILKKITWANVKAFLKTYFDTLYAAETASTIASIINGTTETTILDEDEIPFYKTTGGLLKKISGTNIKAFFKTYFDGLYSSISSRNRLTTVNSFTEVSRTIINVLNIDFTEDLIKNKISSSYASFGIGNLINPPLNGNDFIKTLLIRNDYSVAQSVTWNTSSQYVGVVTYSFVYMKDTSLVTTIPVGKTLEISYEFTYMSSTTCSIQVIYIIQP